MESILNFDQELNISTFDGVVSTFYRFSGPEVFCTNKQPYAKQILEQFQEHPKAWERVDQILEQSALLESKVSLSNKFIALQILEKLVKTMWKILPQTNRQGIKNFIIAFIIKIASDETSLERNKTILGKLNMVLVQVG
jgi:exportin-1